MTPCPNCHAPELEVSDDSFAYAYGSVVATEPRWSARCYACGYTTGGRGRVPQREEDG